MFPPFDSYPKRFMWVNKEVDLAPHTVVGLSDQYLNTIPSPPQKKKKKKSEENEKVSGMSRNVKCFGEHAFFHRRRTEAFWSDVSLFSFGQNTC